MEDGNYVVHTADRGRPTSSTLIDIFKNTIRPGSIVISDSQRSYHQLMDALNIKWVKIPSGEKSKDGYTLEMVNHLHDRIKKHFSEAKKKCNDTLSTRLSSIISI